MAPQTDPPETPRYGPSRGEHRFRLIASLFGLALLAVAIAWRGGPQGAAGWETVGIAGAFFGGSALWSGWQLVRLARGDTDSAP